MLGLVEEVGIGGGLRLRPSSSPSSSSSWLLAARRWAAEAEDAAAPERPPPPRWRRRRTRWMERSAERRRRQRESRERSSAWSTGKRREPEERGVGATRVEMLAGNVGRPPSPEGWVSAAGVGGGGELAVGKKGLLVKGYGSPVDGVAEDDGYLGVGEVVTGGAGGGVGGGACAGGTATGVGVG